jgi:type II secretory pathway pseudopilin PulG
MAPAFTITEAVISMAITSIILSFVFVIFSITSQRLDDFRNQNETIADINRFTYSINKSMFNSEEISYNDNALFFKNFKGEMANYVIDEKYCTRNENDFTDTFHFYIKKLVVDTLKGKSVPVCYQRFQFDIEADKRNLKYCFYKKIHASQLLEKE